jgi:hypothetical protein
MKTSWGSSSASWCHLLGERRRLKIRAAPDIMAARDERVLALQQRAEAYAQRLRIDPKRKRARSTK